MPSRKYTKPPFALFVYLLLFKVGAVLHYSVIAVLGARVLPVWVVGLGNASASFTQLLFDVPAGFLIERFGVARTLRWSTLCFVGAATVLFLPLTPLTYVASLLLSACGWQFYSPSTSAYLLATIPPSHMGRANAARRVAECIGGALAVAGLALYVTLPSALIGLIILYPILGSLVALGFLAHHEKPPAAVAVQMRHHIARSPLHRIVALYRKLHPSATLLSLWNVTSTMFYGSMWLALPLLAARGEQIIGFGLGALDIAVVLVGAITGRLADKRAKSLIVTLSMGVAACLAALVGLSLSWWLIPVAFFLSAADEIVIDTLWSWVDRQKGLTNANGIIGGMTTFFEDMGWMIGPAVTGILLGFLPFSTTISLMAIPMFLTFLLSLFWSRRKS